MDQREHTVVDGWLFFAVAALLAVGITMVLSTSYLYSQEHFSDGTYLWRKQLMAVGVGMTALFFFTFFPLEILRRFTCPLLIMTIVLLTFVLVPGIGLARGEARRWLSLGGFAFQPAELAKPCLVLYLANSLAKKAEKLDTFVAGVLPHLTVAILFLGLIVIEPDLGTSLLLGLVLFLMLFIAGVKFSHLLLLGLLAVPIVVFALIGASSGFEIIQSHIGFASGQLWGRGLGEGRHKLRYLAEGHTDFIFSVVGEEVGLLGALMLLALFCIVIQRGLIVVANTDEPFDRYLAFGLTNLIGLQALIHMGVVMGLIPTNGLVLPFISYGGTAIVINLSEVGILLSLSRRRI